MIKHKRLKKNMLVNAFKKPYFTLDTLKFGPNLVNVHNGKLRFILLAKKDNENKIF